MARQLRCYRAIAFSPRFCGPSRFCRPAGLGAAVERAPAGGTMLAEHYLAFR